MAVRRPLVSVLGRWKELPAGDVPAGALGKDVDDTTTGHVMFDHTLGIRTKGAEGSSSNGIIYFGSEANYIYKTPTAFYFSNWHTGKTATLDAGGTVLTTENGNPKIASRVIQSAYATTSETTNTVTDGTTQMLVLCEAGKKYRVSVIGTYQTAATGTGCKLHCTSGTAAGRLTGNKWALHGDGLSKRRELTIRSLGSPGVDGNLSIQVDAANTAYSIGLEAIFECTTGGNLIIQFATEVAGSEARLNAGSTFLVEEL